MIDPDALDPSAIAALDEMTDGDAAFLAELIDTWVTDSAAQLAIIEQALATADADRLRRAAHSLKSASQTLGAVQLARLSAEVEAHAKQAALDPIAARLPDLQQYLHQARRALLAARPAIERNA
jgi:HPt (histidine-containing phosphotransfer) domain-containing protein